MSLMELGSSETGSLLIHEFISWIVAHRTSEVSYELPQVVFQTAFSRLPLVWIYIPKRTSVRQTHPDLLLLIWVKSITKVLSGL